MNGRLYETSVSFRLSRHVVYFLPIHVLLYCNPDCSELKLSPSNVSSALAMANLQRPPPYNYNLCPLTNPAEDLRILKITLSSTSHDETVEGQIVQYNEDLKYYALSWCWGPRNASKTRMRITHQDQPFEFEISLALESALKQLRRHRVEYLWIDQICA
jgi:hypothetical protein